MMMTFITKRIIWVIAVCSLMPLTMLSQISLLKDIRVGQGSGVLNNPEFVVMDAHMYFFADDGIHGKELWKTDGTEAGTVMVKDIIEGTSSSAPTRLTVVGNMLFFTAIDGVHGRELWKSDGTEQGTVMVQDINAGSASSDPAELIAYNGYLLFAATNGFDGRELWKSFNNGSTTIMVKDIAEGAISSDPMNFAQHAGYVYFSAVGEFGRELYRTAGDALSTTLVSDIFMGVSGVSVNSSNPSAVVSFGNNPYFTANSAEGFRFMTINGGNDEPTIMSPIANPQFLMRAGEKMYFRAFSNTIGTELYQSDGTIGNTTLLKDIREGSGSSSIDNLKDVNGDLFFAADNFTNGKELWTSDGTTAGTVMLKDIWSGSGSSSPSCFCNINNTLFFAASDGIHGKEVWVSDGTEEGTYMVMDLNSGSGWSSPCLFTVFNNSVYFQATTSSTGYEVFKFDLSLLNLTEVKQPSNTLLHTYNSKTGMLYLLEIPEEATIKIWDITGKLLETYHSSQDAFATNVSHLSKGVYIVSLDSKQYHQSTKLLLY